MATTKKSKIELQTFSDVPENVDLNMLITVKNGYHGTLVYVSPRTREQFIWNSFGDEQELELKELRSIKSTNKSFYENNYFMFDDEFSWVIKYLGLTKYYEHAIGMKGFDDLFTSTPAEIKSVVGKMSSGQKKSLVYCVREKIASGEIDSMKVVNALEDALGVNFTTK